MICGEMRMLDSLVKESRNISEARSEVRTVPLKTPTALHVTKLCALHHDDVTLSTFFVEILTRTHL